MIGVVITGHGQFATGLLSSLNLIAGTFTNVVTVDFAITDSTEDLEKNLKTALVSFTNCDKVAFFTDLVGGSPFNCSVLVGETVKEYIVIGGANLPMLLEFMFSRECENLECLKNSVIEAGKNAIKCIGTGALKARCTETAKSAGEKTAAAGI